MSVATHGKLKSELPVYSLCDTTISSLEAKRNCVAFGSHGPSTVCSDGEKDRHGVFRQCFTI